MRIFSFGISVGKILAGTGRKLVFPVLFIGMAFFTIYPVSAQIAASNLFLDDSKPVFDAGLSAYVIADPGRTLNYKKVVEGFNAGSQGDKVNGAVLRLGASGVPHWIILTVTNRSWTSDWVLSFGQHIDGRIGALEDIFVYEANTRTRYVDTVSTSDNPYIGIDMSSSSIKLNVPKGKRSVFVIYAVPKPGNVVTLAPRFMTERNYIERAYDPHNSERLLSLFFLAMAGFFGAAWMFGRLSSGWIFVIYYSLQNALLQNYSNIVYVENDMAYQLPQLLFGGMLITALLMGKLFLGVNAADRMQNKASLG